MPLNQLNKPNILILLTDQQRYEQDWRPEWAVEHLPAMERLKNNGLSFNNAFTSASACSPSRACIFTGTYPAQNGVHHTIVLPGDNSLIGSPPGYSQQPLLPTQPNLARMLKTAGYKVVWKGKWHLSLPVNGTQHWTEADIDYISEAYGFEEWNPNDAGNSVALYSTLGGGSIHNDRRFVGCEGSRLSATRSFRVFPGRSRGRSPGGHSGFMPFCGSFFLCCADCFCRFFVDDSLFAEP